MSRAAVVPPRSRLYTEFERHIRAFGKRRFSKQVRKAWRVWLAHLAT